MARAWLRPAERPPPCLLPAQVYNAHAPSYTWKRTDSKSVARVLDKRKTLDENGVRDDTPEFDTVRLAPLEPAVHSRNPAAPG